MTEEPRPAAAFSSNLFATRKNGSVVIGGQVADERETQWAFTLTRRAAQNLWYDLTRLLFPEKSGEVIGQVSTLRAVPLVGGKSDVTTQVFVTQQPGGGCLLEGWSNGPTWRVLVSAFDVYRFWAALDATLYPAGWQN